MKENFICLIPKKEDSLYVKEFRPISLTTSTYKMLTKALGERIKKVMPNIISNTQNGFISGRQILDLVLIANEAVEEYQAKKKKGWILKLDLKTTFDHVDWSFLEKILTLVGFHAKWVEWMMGCIRNLKFSVFINGRPRGRIPFL